MPEVANPVLEAGAVVLTLAASGIGAKRSTGQIDPVLTWDPATGDLTLTTPIATGGGGTQFLRLPRPVRGPLAIYAGAAMDGALIAGLDVRATTDSTKRVLFGYQDAAGADYGFITAVHTGVTFKPLRINQFGGLVSVGPGGLSLGGTLSTVSDGNFQQAIAITPGNTGLYQSWHHSTGARRGYLGYGSPGAADLQLVNELAGGTVLVSSLGAIVLSSPTFVLIGADPGGPEFVRVNGSARFAGKLVAAHNTAADTNIDIRNTNATSYGIFSMGGGSVGRYLLALHTYDNAQMLTVERPINAGETAMSIFCADVGAVRRVYIGPATAVAPAGARIMYVA